MTPLQKTSAGVFAAITIATTLAGCAPAADGTTTGSTDSGGASESTGPYKDGTYEASADYQSPNGTEEVTVTVTLADGVITAVEVVGDGDNPNSKRYQGEFADGIGDVVVGKNIDEISVDKVAGSSLTSAGFNDAIDAIKADAAS